MRALDAWEKQRPGSYQAFNDFLTLSVLPNAHEYLPMDTKTPMWQEAVKAFAATLGMERLQSQSRNGCVFSGMK